MHQEATPPNISSSNIFHMPKSFRQTPGVHCFCQFQKTLTELYKRQCSSSALTISPIPPWLDAALHLLLIHSAACLLGCSLASVAPWPAHAGVFHGGRT